MQAEEKGLAALFCLYFCEIIMLTRMTRWQRKKNLKRQEEEEEGEEEKDWYIDVFLDVFIDALMYLFIHLFIDAQGHLRALH